jgi:hypothetical protein
MNEKIEWEIIQTQIRPGWSVYIGNMCVYDAPSKTECLDFIEKAKKARIVIENDT